jgi:hypothetical protein
MLLWPGDLPFWLVRFIGVVEFAGALGMILPARDPHSARPHASRRSASS